MAKLQRKKDNIFAKLHGLTKYETNERVEYLAVLFGMKAYLDRRVGGFSKGMRQKVTIARTLIHNPEIILFDEPRTRREHGSNNIFTSRIVRGNEA